MAKQIKSFGETQLTAGVRVSFHESVSKLIEKYTPAALHIETQVTVYLDKIEEAQELIRRPTAYASTQILRAEKPEGPYVLHSDGPVTPHDWECLDGTFYVEKSYVLIAIYIPSRHTISACLLCLF